MFKKIDFSFEIKAIGYAFYFSFLPFLFFVFQFLFGEKELSFILLKQMEFLIVPFSAWWIIFLYHDYFEEGGSDLLYSYPLKAEEHGLLRIGVFSALYEILIAICCMFLIVRFPDANFFVLFIQYAAESLLYISIGFVIILLTKKVMVPILMIVAYVSTEFLTEGSIIPVFHIMSFNTEPLSFDQIIFSVLLNGCISVILFVFGHLYLRKKTNLRLF
ncbi:hypothetical protein [Fictibacillus gelatini]|uniref:hypothetical protein n=1 Tax=Fictibacillus gelatini TaxID=225985 RepID=UPI00041D71C4|nr:hypothetical protein [Fictibacillus gelatini]